MQGEKKRKGRGKKITSALGVLDNEPYRTIIDVINYLEEAEPQQIRCVINNEDEENLKLDHIHTFDSVGRWVNSKEEYKRKTREVKQLIQSHPDKPLFNPFTPANIRDYLDKLIEWRIVEKIERRRYQIAPSFKNEIIRKSNKRIIDHYSRDDISDFSESNLIAYGFEHLRKQLEGADRSECGQKLLSKRLSNYPDTCWFSTSTKLEEYLNKGDIPQELRDIVSVFFMFFSADAEWRDISKEFSEEKQAQILSLRDVTITKQKDKEWIIEGGFKFIARKEGDMLNIYDDDLRLFGIDADFSENTGVSDSATIAKEKRGEWIIDDERELIIRKEEGKLKIYKSYAAQRRIGKDHITIIHNRIERIKHELEELHKEKEEATNYLSYVENEQHEIYHKYLDKFRKEQKENLTKEQKEKLRDIFLNQEQSLNILMFGVEDADKKSVKDYEKYVKEKLLPLPPPTPPPILDITLFYSEKLDLNLPSSVEVAISAASWNSAFSALKDKTISEEELEKRTKELYQEYDYEIQKVVSNSICFAYYRGKFGPVWKGKK